MRTENLNGRVLISSMYDEFNIVSRDWESRAPRWIYDALRHLEISLQTGTKTMDISFDNYKFKLPVRMELLRDIFINDIRLDYTDVTGFKFVNQELEDKGITDLRYYTIDDGYVILELKSGTAQLAYTQLPLAWDEELHKWIPEVPDIPEVIENIKWYMLKIILARGYKHPVYSLISQNAYNNPDIRWQQTKKAAKFAARRLTKQQRKDIAYTLKEFISEQDVANNDLISELYRTDLNINK